MSLLKIDETPKPEVRTAFVDHNPERNYASTDKMAWLLGVSARHLRRLEKSGLLRREPAGPFAGQFAVAATMDAWVAYKTRDRSAARNRLDERRAEILQRRLDREAPNLVTIAEVIEAFDYISNAFQVAVDHVAARLPEGLSTRPKALQAIAETKRHLENRAALERIALLTGERK